MYFRGNTVKLPWWLKTVKNLPVMQKSQVVSLDQEDPLKKGMANHSSILAWKIPWSGETDVVTAHGVAKSWT